MTILNPPKNLDTFEFRKWLVALQKQLNSGYSGTITTAKLTAGGANGSMVFKNGVLVSQTAAT